MGYWVADLSLGLAGKSVARNQTVFGEQKISGVHLEF